MLTGLLIQTSLFCFSQTTSVDSIISGGIYRSFRIYVPAAYNASSARPLVLDLHGYTSNAYEEQYYSNFMPIADTANFILVYPQGTSYLGQPFWNAGMSSTAVNDVQFISDLIDHVSSLYSIDPNSVYSCGMSHGGFMSHTLACALNNRIAAIASVTGSMYYTQHSLCTPNRAVPVMQMSGTYDSIVPYTGNASFMTIDNLVNFWVTNNNCPATPVFSNVPNIYLLDYCTAEHYVYNGGDNGSSVELYKIIGGGHSWPGSQYIIGVTNEDFNASEKIWLFFRKYKLSQFVGIEEKKNENLFSMYPNPCFDKLTIEGKDITHISIMDMNGRVVLESNQKQIDVSTLSKGVYSLIYISGNSRSVKKLVKL